MIPIYRPFLPSKCLSRAHEALESGWVSSHGRFIREATERLQELLGVKYVQLVSNGTCATHLLSKILKFKHPQITRLYVPNNVYVAAWNAVLYDGDYDYIIPIDADIETWNLHQKTLIDSWYSAKDIHEQFAAETGLLAVHNLGNIINIPELQKNLPFLPIIEDNCEGFLGKYNNLHTGTSCLASSLSFFGNKNITSGEGGAIVTNDEESYLYARSLRGQGESSDRYIHDKLAYNYRMTNVQAALLCGQLDCLPEILERKEAIFSIYKKGFSNSENILIQEEEENTISSNWMMGIRIIGSPGFRDISSFLKKNNIDCRPMFYPMSRHKHLQKYAQHTDEEASSLLAKEVLLLPSYPELTPREQEHIMGTIKKYIKERGIER